MVRSVENLSHEPKTESDKDEPTVENDNVLKLVPPVDTRRKEAHYTVGRNDFGDTVFKLHGEHGLTSTLTMNVAATLQLIRMLEATIPEEYTDA